MAKKKQRTRKPPAAAPTAPPAAKAKAAPLPEAKVVALPAPAPVFWFGFEVAWAKLLGVRVVLFALLALDALLQIRHAPRYGAGGFNVAQLPGLDAIGPTRVTYELAQLVSAYLFVLAALGVATRFVLPGVTAIYAWLYFTSQLDSYQHHYLVALILAIGCFVPWQRPDGATPGTRVRTWAVRLILVQLGILNVWAAISKMNAAWLDGRTLAGQITGPLRGLVDSSVGIKAAARFTILVELTLAMTVWIRPAWFVALPLGILFHTGIILSGLEIGLFAWLMLAMYLLLVPDRTWVWIAETRYVARLRSVLGKIRLEGDLATGLAVVGGAAAAVVAGLLCRFDHALTLALVLGLVPVAVVIARRFAGRGGGGFAGIAHVVAILVWVLVDRVSTVAVDYYRFWGGSARRLGDAASAELAYRRLVEIDPEEPSGHYQLGRLLLKRGEETSGLDELHLAQVNEPARARAWIAEAQYLAGKGKRAEATEKAREGTYSEPDSKEAKDLLDALSGNKKITSPGTQAPDDDTDHP